MSGKAEGPESTGRSERRLRADARRNIDALLEAAKAVFLTSGVDAPVREIAEKAGVGIGTIYRHFPHRSDLVVGVFQREVDACVDAASALAAEHEPDEALARWIRRFVEFISAKRGLAAALHSGDPAYCALPAYFQERLLPAFRGLMEAAVAAGQIRSGVEPYGYLLAVASLCTPSHDLGPDHARRMVDLLIDGLRYRASEA
ncbi:TetR/AcrR family transcriptional regulator [Aquisphaera insulae]|uniref:TetR/AcrR family transcriptional regulator n=1 Tax=Aquisphaera insulae TaxID=2712864 RepID=UPI00196A3744|nr:TetR/AcrR family transcriptional regulator [Aquisphaera insulae]